MMLLNNVIPQRKLATFALEIIDDTFKALGIPRFSLMEETVYVILVVLIAFITAWILRKLAIFFFNKGKRINKSAWYAALQSNKVLMRISNVIPGIIYLGLIPFGFSAKSKVLNILMDIGFIYLILVFVLAINSIIAFIWHRYDSRENKRNHPLKGLMQISQGIVWLIGIILLISLLLGKSPVVLLTGLGAFAAVLMLIFKDSILGVVAGVQLSQNDMLRVGDWIVVPNTPADGVVIDVTLTVVKVRNWDNTIAMLPPYSLVSTSFQNWRGMIESGRRRIERSYYIDADSVQNSTDKMLNNFLDIPLMKDYITQKKAQRDNGTQVNTANPDGLVNGTIDTNLGMFRAYLTMYLKQDENISKEETLMVRELAPTPSGIPLQIYCFTNTVVWVNYESIQSEIFEHFAAMAPRFGLYVFENPSGRDTVNQGFLEGGIKPNQIYGLPYQSIYNWSPGPDPKKYKSWDKSLPQNHTFDSSDD